MIDHQRNWQAGPVKRAVNLRITMSSAARSAERTTSRLTFAAEIFLSRPVFDCVHSVKFAADIFDDSVIREAGLQNGSFTGVQRANVPNSSRWRDHVLSHQGTLDGSDSQPSSSPFPDAPVSHEFPIRRRMNPRRTPVPRETAPSMEAVRHLPFPRAGGSML